MGYYLVEIFSLVKFNFSRKNNASNMHRYVFNI